MKNKLLEDALKKPKKRKPKEQLKKNNILELLQEREMTQSELSDLSDLTPQHLSRIIHNQRKCISLPTAIKISRAFNLPVEKVFIY
jgi:DNA-binding XRE family transcriptional regulator